MAPPLFSIISDQLGMCSGAVCRQNQENYSGSPSHSSQRMGPYLTLPQPPSLLVFPPEAGGWRLGARRRKQGRADVVGSGDLEYERRGRRGGC